MRRFYLSIVFVCACFITQQASAAQPGWYASGMIGLTILSDSDLTSPGATSRVESDAGVGFGAAGGWEFGNGIRTELELSYRINGADRQFSPDRALGGSTSSFAVMANGFYDFDLGQWVPYVGGGLGFAVVSMELDSGGAQLVDDSDTVLAYQLAGGVGYKLMPKMIISVDYRLFGTTDAELVDSVGARFDAEYFTHNIMLGARYKF